MRIADYFDAAAALYPGHLMIAEGAARLDYATAQKWVHAVAHALVRHFGGKKSAHIAIYAPNDHRVMLLHLAINRADMAWLSVHTRNSLDTNIEVLNYFDCEFVFFHSDYENVVPQLKAGLPLAKTFICKDRASPHGEHIEKWIADCWRPFASAPEDPHTAMLLQPTGGTTGPSKGGVHTHRSFEMVMVSLFETLSITPQSRHLVVSPLTHAAGFMGLGFVPRGAANIVLPGFDAETVLAAIEREGITHLYLPPTGLYALLAHPKARTTNFSSLKFFAVAAAPCAPDKFKEAVNVFGPVMHELYGQTEILFPVLAKYPADYLRADGSFDEDVVCSAGKAVPFAWIEIMDDEGNVVPSGQPGEIVVRSTCVMQGYYKKPEETRAVSKFGWHHTSDVGVKDARGFITIVDRKKDLIISGGFNIYPVEVETVILSHVGVLECAVVGVPDEKWGEAVKAVIALKPGVRATEDEFITLCKSKLGSMKAPKSVEFWEKLPHSAVGKLLKREIRAKFWEGQWRRV
jgi:acyl-CoA synthetase (AMP-forming)/AMP-acid ligase II